MWNNSVNVLQSVSGKDSILQLSLILLYDSYQRCSEPSSTASVLVTFFTVAPSMENFREIVNIHAKVSMKHPYGKVRLEHITEVFMRACILLRTSAAWNPTTSVPSSQYGYDQH